MSRASRYAARPMMTMTASDVVPHQALSRWTRRRASPAEWCSDDLHAVQAAAEFGQAGVPFGAGRVDRDPDLGGEPGSVEDLSGGHHSGFFPSAVHRDIHECFDCGVGGVDERRVAGDQLRFDRGFDLSGGFVDRNDPARDVHSGQPYPSATPTSRGSSTSVCSRRPSRSALGARTARSDAGRSPARIRSGSWTARQFAARLGVPRPQFDVPRRVAADDFGHGFLLRGFGQVAGRPVNLAGGRFHRQ